MTGNVFLKKQSGCICMYTSFFYLVLVLVLTLQRSIQAAYVCILRSKSVCTDFFFKEAVRLYMYVYFVLEACARESTLSRSSHSIYMYVNVKIF